jgi:hypothetical protein
LCLDLPRPLIVPAHEGLRFTSRQSAQQ